MDARDFDIFARAFHRAVLVFDKHVGQADEALLAQSYFKVLQAYPLRTVLAVLKQAIESAVTFPKPMELLERLPPAGGDAGRVPLASGRRREMTLQEIEDYADAASSGFSRPPCGCWSCVEAGIDHQPIRFVPTLEDDGDREVRARNPRTGRYDVIGHWAHGDELKRWYATRRAFYDSAKRTSLAPVLPFLVRDRVPGEDDD